MVASCKASRDLVFAWKRCNVGSSQQPFQHSLAPLDRPLFAASKDVLWRNMVNR